MGNKNSSNSESQTLSYVPLQLREKERGFQPKEGEDWTNKFHGSISNAKTMIERFSFFVFFLSRLTNALSCLLLSFGANY